MDEFDAFINKTTDAKLAQYIASRQKEIAKLLEKRVFKFVTTADILNNAWIFNFCFVHKVKNTGTDKTYEKNQLVV